MRSGVVAGRLPGQRVSGETALPLHTEGGSIVDAAGKTVTLTGVNWFGLETSTFAPDGLWARNYKSMLDQIAASGFNAIRLPYSNALFRPGRHAERHQLHR